MDKQYIKQQIIDLGPMSRNERSSVSSCLPAFLWMTERCMGIGSIVAVFAICILGLDVISRHDPGPE